MDDAVRIAFEAGLPFTGLRGFRPDARLLATPGLPPGVVPLGVRDGRLVLAAPTPDVDLSGLRRPASLVIAPAREVSAALAVPVTDPSAPRRLGDLLVARGAADDAAVAGALAEQARTGGRLGDVLLARGAVGEQELVAALAEQLGLPVVDLDGYEADAHAVAALPEAEQRALRCVPLAADDEALYLAVAEPPDERGMARLRAASGLEPRCFLAPRRAVDALLQRVHSAAWAAEARDGLRRRFPAQSSHRLLTGGQAVALSLLLGAVLAALAVAPRTASVVLLAVAAAITLPALAAAAVVAALGARGPG
ncbi:MAG: hypothetical protein HZB46_03405, partial [Solirubrobacterales bacterium]|nr:hypothetical protein [Solirubrobacterales bacterium]